MKHRTTDRAQSDVFTVERLGRSQEMTPEGFLLCRDVPIARIGEMLYGAGEVPVVAGRDGIVRITRDETVLLAPQTIASLEGKAVTLDHPDEDVNPANWRDLSRGFARNVRPGEGDLAGMVVADLLIMDADAISQVREGLRETSLGYDAEYADDGGGRGRQMSIIGNHIALVRRGRCGPVCSIGDSEMKTRDKSSKTYDKKTFMDKMKAAFFSKDEEGFVRELEGAPDVADIDGDDKTHNITINLQGAAPAADPASVAGVDTTAGITDPAAAAAAVDPMAPVLAAIAALGARLDKLEGGGAAADPLDDGDGENGDPLADEDDDGVPAKDDEDDNDPTRDAAMRTRDARTTDSKALADEFTDTLARAEILSPGIKLPTFDAKLPHGKTFDSMCLLRRRALHRVSDEHKDAIAPLLSGLDLRKATCDSIKAAFVGASELARRTNDGQNTRIVRRVLDTDTKGIPSIAEINAKNRATWAAKRA